VIVVALFVLLLRQGDAQTDDPTQDAVRGARTYPMYESVAVLLEAVLPVARERAGEIYRNQQGESAPIPPADPAPEPDAAPN
jgi:hypothetical protein